MAKRRSNNKLIYILAGTVVVLGIVAMVGKKQGWIGKGNQKEVTFGKTERMVQIRWKKIMKKLHCVTSVQVAAKIASRCKKYPPTVGEIIEISCS